MHTRRGEVEHPSDVERHHEMPGRTHDVRAQNAPGIERPLDRVVAGAIPHA
jgi:hypothetical protein